MSSFHNFDLLSVGFVVASTGILGSVIYFSNPKSITNKYFLGFSVSTMLWGVVSYLNYQVANISLVLFLIKLVLFFAIFQAYFFYKLMSVFPNTTFTFTSKYRRHLKLAVLGTALLTLTPFVYSGIKAAPLGTVSQPIAAPGILLFVILAVSLVGNGIFLMVKKRGIAGGIERKQFTLLLSGVSIMFTLIIVFNLIFPTLLNNTRFIPLSALFVFPFVLFTAYAIARHHLFNVKVVSTAIITFFLALVSFIEIIFANTASLIIFRSSIFILVLIFGINLIRGVLREVEQREKIEHLASELQLANDRQEGLIHFVSHQIKGYLTKSKAAFAGILEGDFGETPDSIKSVAKEGLRDNQEGVETVMSILSAANLKKGTVTYKRESFDFRKVVVDQIEGHTKEARNKNLTLETIIPGDVDFTTIGDRDQLSQHVVGNLIDNSIKYTLKGGLKISLAKKDGKIFFSIKDTGVGITEEDKKRLFTEGGRGKESTKVNVNSTGYGLFIAKEIVEAHKGRIWAESEGTGKGSTFWVELPAA